MTKVAKFFNLKIPEIENKIKDLNINNSVKNYDFSQINPNMDVIYDDNVSKSYMMLLNLEYIRMNKNPSLIRVSSKILDNT